MKRILPIAIFLVIVLVLYLFHGKNINSFPTKIHSWAQSDRYALALGFIENNFDFFHPQTYNLTESPDHSLTPRETSITAVDFPINDYIAALLMKIFGTTDPWCFRLYTFIYSIIGMFFLYLLSVSFLNNRALSLFVVLFCVTSPVYLYYQIGFLPTIPAISNLFIGVYLFFKYLKSQRVWHYSLSLFFITIAVLSRKPFLIFLIAIMVYEFWTVVRSKKANLGITITLLLSSFAIFGYFLYNRFLQQKYGAAFLGSFMPPESIGQSVEITKTVFNNWFYQYFTGYHYIVLIALLAISTYSLYRRKKETNTNGSILLVFITFTLAGFLIYYVVMMRQFPDHDYYFLDSFYSVICLLLIYLTSNIPLGPKTSNVIGIFGAMIFATILFTANKEIQQKREETGFWDRVEITTNNFEGSETLLKENNVPATARILVVDSYTANIPFIKMKRFGYAMMSKKPKDIQKVLDWDYDFIVMQDCYALSDIVTSYPPIMNEIERIAGNGKISIYKKQKTKEKRDAFRFLQLDSKTPVIVKEIDFDSPTESCWQNIYSKKLEASPYGISGILTDSIFFSTTLSLKNSALFTQQVHFLYLSMDVFSDERLHSTRLAVSVDEDEKSKYFNTFELDNLVDTLSKWKHIQLIFPILPCLKSNSNELKAFIWNDGRHRLYYDNIHISVY